jgi:hypothetical protein
MREVDKEIEAAMMEVSVLSNVAKAQGDLPTMYAANRAWRELYDAYADLEKRRAAMSPADGGTP